MYISCLYIYIYSTHHWFNTCRVLANSIHVAIMLLVGVPLRFLRWRKKSNSTRTCGTWRGGGLCAQQHKPGTAEGRCGERLNKKFRNWRRWAWESLSNILSYFSIFSRIWSIYDIQIYTYMDVQYVSMLLKSFHWSPLLWNRWTSPKGTRNVWKVLVWWLS